MKSYALHDTVHELLSSFAAKPSGSLLILGKRGSGLSMAISYIIHSIYGGKERPGEVIRVNEGTIDEIRMVIKQISQSRVNRQKPRLVVIDDAQKLTLEAQNALLKSLEEPPENTHFVLACSVESGLLTTIRSRCTTVKLKKPNIADLKKIFSEYSEAEFDQAYLMSDGWPGTMRSILEDKDSVVKQQIARAKEYLALPRHQKIISSLKPEGSDVQDLLEGLMRISSASMRRAIEDGREDQALYWQRMFQKLHGIDKQAERGLQTKIIGLRLALEL